MAVWLDNGDGVRSWRHVDAGFATVELVALARRVDCDYVLSRLDNGDTKTSALRALRRRISDEVYKRLHADLARLNQPAPNQVLAIAA